METKNKTPTFTEYDEFFRQYLNIETLLKIWIKKKY